MKLPLSMMSTPVAPLRALGVGRCPGAADCGAGGRPAAKRLVHSPVTLLAAGLPDYVPSRSTETAGSGEVVPRP